MSKEKIILGIDPGTQIMGYGIIEVQGKSFKMIDLGSIKFKLADTPILRLKLSSSVLEKGPAKSVREKPNRTQDN